MDSTEYIINLYYSSIQKSQARLESYMWETVQTCDEKQFPGWSLNRQDKEFEEGSTIITLSLQTNNWDRD